MELELTQSPDQNTLDVFVDGTRVEARRLRVTAPNGHVVDINPRMVASAKLSALKYISQQNPGGSFKVELYLPVKNINQLP